MRKKSDYQGNQESGEGVIEGRNAVLEAVRAGRPIDKVYIVKGDTDHTLSRIEAAAKNMGAVIVQAERRKLDQMSLTGSHQGIIAIAAVKEYSTVEDILSIAKSREEAPFLVICDEISDPHNLGAIIRTAECAGVHGVIIPQRRSAGLTATVYKTSAGAAEHMAVARVPNITAVIKHLKKEGLWIFGAAAEGATKLWNADLKSASAIVIGSEGNGMGRLVSENCDFKVSLPMHGKVSSLNASAAAAVLMYEAVRQRSAQA